MFEVCGIILLSTSSVLSKTESMTRAFRIPERKDKHTAYEDTLKKIEEGKRRRIGHEALLLSPVYRIAISTAASLILIFLLHLFLFSSTTLQAGNQADSFRLPDHSRVILSSNSAINYSTYHWNRKLQLQGEAYFEVNEGKKFIVKTDEGSVSVLGTRFLVTEKEDQLTVSCFEGKVAFENKDVHEIIPAGTSADFKDNALTSKTETTLLYPSAAIFNQQYSAEKIQTVLAALENFFQVTIHIETSKQHLFSGHLETAQLESALAIISRSLDLDYYFKSDEVIYLTEKREV